MADNHSYRLATHDQQLSDHERRLSVTEERLDDLRVQVERFVGAAKLVAFIVGGSALLQVLLQYLLRHP